jgi:hypothetical protein
MLRRPSIVVMPGEELHADILPERPMLLQQAGILPLLWTSIAPSNK